MALTAAEVWRDNASAGIPSSGVHEPKKSEIRAWGGNIEIMLNAGGLGGAVWKANKTLLTADLAHPADTLAVVYEDATAANNGLYVKAGASGAGAWTQITTFLPGYQFVTALDDGSSTPNAYTMDTNPRLPAGDGVALVEFVVPATNTSGTVTVSFDGDAPLTIKTASGNSPAVGGLIEGMPISGVKIGADLFMRSDQASAAVQAGAEAAAADALEYRDQAAAYADFARNNWVIAASGLGTGSEEDVELLVDPGSVNNMFVVVGGVGQLVTQGAYSLVYSGSDAFIRINVPLDVPYEVRVSNAVPIGTPADGTVSPAKIANGAVETAKLADKAATFAKIQDIATARVVGRSSVGSGPVQELTEAEFKAMFNITSATSEGFSAHKNATNQTGVVSDTWTKVTFTTEVYDLGSDYNNTLSRWIPPAGLISITAQVVFLGTITAGADGLIAIYKNGALLKAIGAPAFTNQASTQIALQDQSDGDDYYEVYAKVVGSGLSISGAASSTFFMGRT